MMLHRLADRSYDELRAYGVTGSIVLDWSTHLMDDHITRCVSSLVASQKMDRLRGGVTYGSSAALPPLQVADIVAYTLRRAAEGAAHLTDYAKMLTGLSYRNADVVDGFGNEISSLTKVF